MKVLKRIAFALIVGAASAQLAVAAPVPEKDFKTLAQAQPTEAPGKIEVLEFFQYGCGHCYDLEPTMKAWSRKKPKDVEFRYVPTVWDESRVPLAKTFYALEALGLLEQMHDKVYDAIHQKQVRLSERDVMMKWIAQQPGVDAKKFEEAYDSFGVNNKVQRAAQMTKAFRISGTPTIAVNGKYLTGPSYALDASSGSVDYNKMTQTLDDLIGMERKKK